MKKLILLILTIIFSLVLTTIVFSQDENQVTTEEEEEVTVTTEESDEKDKDYFSENKYRLNEFNINMRVFYGFEFFVLKPWLPLFVGQSVVGFQFLSGNTVRAGFETGIIFDNTDRYYPMMALLNFSVLCFMFETGIGGLIYKSGTDFDFDWGLDLGVYIPIFLTNQIEIDIGTKSYLIMNSLTKYRIILVFDIGFGVYL